MIALQGEHVSSVSHGRDVRMRHCFKLSEYWLHVIVAEADEGAFVSHLIAVIGGTEYGDTLIIVFQTVPFVFNFMRPYHKLQIIIFQEILSVIRSKAESESSFTWTPAQFWLRICP